MQIEQAVDEFLNHKPSVDGCIAIWELLADEVQNGDQDIAIEQAGRIATLTKAIVSLRGDESVWATLSSFTVAFVPALEERGMYTRPDARRSAPPYGPLNPPTGHGIPTLVEYETMEKTNARQD